MSYSSGSSTRSHSVLPVSRNDNSGNHSANIFDYSPTVKFTPPNSRQILRIAVNLKYVIDQIIPIAYEIDDIVCENSRILTPKVINLVYEACGGNKDDQVSLQKYRSVIIYALLNVHSWYEKLAIEELHNNDLYKVRSTTAQQLCKIIIDREEINDLDYMLVQMLLHRYSICENDEDSIPCNALELATDLHCTIVIGCSGYQRCLKWLWRGWIIQSRSDPTLFVKDETVSSLKFIDHFDPGRIKTPMYQNFLELFFSTIFLILYTIVVNGKSSSAVQPMDTPEIIFYLFTTGHICSEIAKFYYVGHAYLSFWTCFNDTLYSIILVSMSLRFLSVGPFNTTLTPEDWDRISYRILSCAAPLIWSRLLLYLESQRFVGVMMVVLKHMMTESLVFFVLLFLIMIGFLQGFLGLDLADGKREITVPILANLVITVMGSGSFDMFEKFAPPYAALLYYGYCFIVTVILLNILIALYSNAYQKVVDNADEEYMALMSQKTLRYIRAPDEDVYVSPLNLIEILLQPIFRILSENKRRELSRFVMTILYSPMLFFVAIKEMRESNRIKYNRMRKLEDDANEIDTIWDLTDGYLGTFDGIFSSDVETGIRATEIRNNESLQLQREAERLDYNFSVPNGWYKKVKNFAVTLQEDEKESSSPDQIIEIIDNKFKENEQKINDLNSKIDELTNLIKELKLEKK